MPCGATIVLNCLAEGDDRRIAERAGQRGGAGMERGIAADADHAAARLPQVRQRGAAAAHVSKRLAFQPFKQPFIVERLDVAAYRSRSVVDQYVESAEGVDCRLHRADTTFGGEEINRDGLCLHARRRDFRFRFRERRLVTAADSDVRTFRRESQRDAETHAAVAAGDQY
jgi:hypothetical protein